MICTPNSILFPMKCDIFYPDVEQSGYGQMKKAWRKGKEEYCYFVQAGPETDQDVKIAVSISQEQIYAGRVPSDIRFSSDGDANSITNILIANIRDRDGNIIYLETSGPRKGNGTVFEISSVTPSVNPFGSIEYYSVLIKRSENQEVDA